jgi:hypothetical protein
MAEGNMNISIKLSLKGLRSRKNDVSEIKVNCIIPDCTVKQKTFRVMARHFNEKHAETHKALGIQCDFCEWSCHNNLRCFMVHMHQKHDLTVHMDTFLNLKSVRKTKYSNHTFTCSAMIAENLALNRVKKAEERVVVKSIKKKAKLALKGKKNIPLEILLSEHAVEGEDITVSIDEETVSMFTDDSDDNEYDSDDIQLLSDVESEDDDDDDSPVKVKTTKAFIEKLNGSKRKLNLSVEIVFDSKKRKLSL